MSDLSHRDVVARIARLSPCLLDSVWWKTLVTLQMFESLNLLLFEAVSAVEVGGVSEAFTTQANS